MSTATTDTAAEVKPEEARPETTSVHLSYSGVSTVLTAEEGTSQVALYTNLKRDPVKVEGKVNNPLRLREALSVLYGIVASDFRYVPKDRTAYMAYMRMKRESASLGIW